MKKETVMNLLVSAGAAIEAALSMLDEEEVDCQHPKDSRKYMNVMGIDRWQCKDCGYIYEKKLKKEEVDG